MSKEKVLELLSEHRAEMARRFGIKELAIFGSVAEGQASETGDVDVLVDFGDSISFDHFMDLKFYLEDLLRKPIDLVTEKALRMSMRGQIKRSAIYVT